MSSRSLEDVLQTRSAIDLARNSQIGPYVYPSVPSEFTNWRDEQRAWRETSCLFDQSYHMTDLYIKGPDALRLLSDLAINSFDNFAVNKAKQFVACNYDGHVIGDAILFYLDDELLSLVGRPSAHNWVQYHCETGNYDATTERDERAAVNPGNRQALPLPGAGAQCARGAGEGQRRTAAGHQVLQHGRDHDRGPRGARVAPRHVRRARARAVRPVGAGQGGQGRDRRQPGEEFGLRQVGSRVYATNTLESGWIPCPLPAIFTGDDMKAYREWLPADWYEGTGSLGGSYYSDDISDYYTTPFDLGYGGFVRFDHDFIGRGAIERMSANPKRQKVTLAWHGEDVAAAMETMFHKGDRAKYIDLPLSNYSTWPNDRIMKDGKMVGVSTFSGYSSNESSMLSLAYVDTEQSEPGTEVTLVWGEEGGGSRKPVVERHVQTEIRATVSPVPYAEVVRASYRPK